MVSAAPQAWYLPRIIQTNNASAAAVEKLAWDHAMDHKKTNFAVADGPIRGDRKNQPGAVGGSWTFASG
jgi:hypothetical protein